jgi:fucose 4-O-acetylase-like acetyltransferase
MPSTANYRDSSIDAAKGIGIILVALGHNWIPSHEKGELWKAIFSFHMPLFLFLSGVTLNAANPKFAFLPRVHALLKPAAFIGTLIIAKDIALHGVFLKSMYNVMYATGATLPSNQPLWYLPHIFLAISLSTLIINASNFKREKILAFLVALLILSETIPLCSTGLPWSIDILPFSTAIILAGYAAQHDVRLYKPKKTTAIFFIIIFLSLQYIFDSYMDLSARKLPNTADLIIAGIGIAATISISKIITGPALRSLAYIGKASLFILLIHQPIDTVATNMARHLASNNYLAATIGLLTGICAGILLYAGTQRFKILRALLSNQSRSQK